MCIYIPCGHLIWLWPWPVIDDLPILLMVIVQANLLEATRFPDHPMPWDEWEDWPWTIATIATIMSKSMHHNQNNDP